jgi:hypothetical protein
MTQMTLSITLDEKTYDALKQRALVEHRDVADVASEVVAEWVMLDDELRAEFAAWEKASDDDLHTFEEQLT